MSGHADTVRTVSTAEAAYLLGVSERTVRRWVSKGKLRGELEDGVLLVHLSTAAADTLADTCGHEDNSADSGGQRADARGQVEITAVLALSERMQESLALTDRLQRENVELAGRVGFLQAKLQEAEEKILALSPPVAPEPEPSRPPLWRRLLGLSPA